MKSPITGKEMKLQKERRNLMFRKEEYEVVYHYFLCEDSREKFTNDTLDEINLRQLYNQYRVAHKLPFPEDIKGIRLKYGLSASKMAEVLGFGVNVYRNYEAGEVPNESNARLIQLAADPRKFRELLEISQILEGDDLFKLEKHIDKLIENKRLEGIQKQFAETYLLDATSLNDYTGYRKPNFDKLTEMVVFFSQKLKPWKTQLNKLLFYADFLHYKKTCYAISGARYRAIDMGPVLNNFNSIFEYMVNQGDIDILKIEFTEEKVGEQFAPNAKRDFNPEVFTDEEMETLEAVSEKLGHLKTKAIIEISHKEEAWKTSYHAGKQIISYKNAFDLLAI